MSDKTTGDIANRVGLWVAVVGMGVYVMNIGAWVGAADEKFADAQTVEEKQDAMLLQQNTMATKQEVIEEQLDKMEEQMDEDKKEILAAIASAHKDD